jgi:signal peptidase I
LTATVKKLWKNDYVQTAIVILLIVTVVFGFWYGSQAILNTSIPPALAVVSGSMDTISDGASPGWTHPLDRTLQIGDLIIIQGVDPDKLNTDYPNSDIIVFHRPDNPSELIVHRIVSTTMIDGKLYFFTKGDGNPPVTWPESQEGMYDKWINSNSSIPIGAVNQDLVVGKVIMRIPLIGYLPMFVQSP